MCGTPQTEISQSAKATVNIADLPSYQFFPELLTVFSDSDRALQRGVFQRIQADKIDLPSTRPPPDAANAHLWIKCLPAHLQPLFENTNNPFSGSVIKHLKSAKAKRSLPLPNLYASEKEYSALLEKAEQAGMLHWSNLSQDAQYATMADSIEMTLFAVSKPHDRSRLNSWPRVQNNAMPQPPYTSLPNPSMFEAIRTHGTPRAFFLDISNMFHNITLPLWLARLLLMKPIPFSVLTPSTQSSIAKRMKLPADTATLILRPCQATIPMGFKRAVFTAHTFISSCFEESFRLLKSSRLAPNNMELTKLRAEDAPFLVTESSPLLLHTIDDAAAITVNWPPNLVKTWHRLTRNVLRFNLLPVAERKSSDPTVVESKSVNFIGHVWNLKEGITVSSADKLERITACVKDILKTKVCASRDWERITGKLLWCATLNRPLLACTQSIFYERRFSKRQYDHSITYNHPSKRELRTLTALLPLARVDINLPICHIVVAFDALNLAGAVTYAYAPPILAEKLWKAAQAVRLSRKSNPSQQLQEVTEVIQACHWKLAFTHYWKTEEHINCLEAATAVLSAEWISRSRMNSCKAIFLTDSLVTLGALQKGRSSRTGLLLRCRRFAAILSTHDPRVTLVFVRSAMNPADKYTRIPKPITQDQSASADHATI